MAHNHQSCWQCLFFPAAERCDLGIIESCFTFAFHMPSCLPSMQWTGSNMTNIKVVKARELGCKACFESHHFFEQPCPQFFYLRCFFVNSGYACFKKLWN